LQSCRRPKPLSDGTLETGQIWDSFEFLADIYLSPIQFGTPIALPVTVAS
jgi:hypothetical protein